MRAGRRLAALALAGILSGTALAAEPTPTPATLALQGNVQHKQALTLADIKALPATDIDVTFDTEHGKVAGKYTGVLLWTLLDRAGLPEEGPKSKHHLQRSVLVTGADGYAVSLSIGELDPDFENKQAVIAYAHDGKPETGLRLVVPGDRKAGGSVHDVVRIELE